MDLLKASYSIINARVVTPERIVPCGSVSIEDGIIREISEGSAIKRNNCIDARGGVLLPGFIDIHSDAIEKEIESRPGIFLDTKIALFELDKKLAAAGVTTMYHSLSFSSEGVILIRSLSMVENVIREIQKLKDLLTVKTKIHARYEITNSDDVRGIEELAREGLLDLVSLMDHTPGQGQFKEKEQIHKYYNGRYGVGDFAIRQLVEERVAHRERVGDRNARAIADICKANRIPLASHDDDTVDKVLDMKDFGSVISEFPVTLEAVKEAKRCGMAVALGSPNILRGRSHNDNLNARAILAEGNGDIVCSDYIPSTLLHALFVIVKNKIFDLTQSVKFFSANPAKALGIDHETGSIESGKSADLVLVDDSGELPRIKKTFVRGREVYSVCLE